jgi:hypothetical protein
MTHRIMRTAGACLAASVLLVAAKEASAADCSTFTKPTYITGSSAAKPFVAALGKALSGTVTLVYKGQGSCNGPDAIINGTKMTGTASYWDAAGTETSCTLDTAGQVADIGASDVFATSCDFLGITSLPATVGDFFGPNQVMNFVVPTASSQKSISAEAAYLTFGLGAAGEAAPWTDEAFLFIRNQTSGTQQMLSRAIKVPANKWKGVDSGGSGAVLTKVTSSTSPEKTLGILASDVADANRDKMNILAFKAFGQTCGYLPDSTATSFDKANVRDGHYPVWGPLHFFAKIDATSKKPTLEEAKNFIGYFDGSVATPTGVNLMDLEITSHTIPQCAMHVKRSSELGALASFQPDVPCGCYFEKKATGTAPTSCTTCTDDGGCTGALKHCRFGYCEAK